MLISAFIIHKKAESFNDCQDRFSVNPDTKSIAVSDGLSQSIFQKIWASQLVQAYTDKVDWVPTPESVKELAPLWKAKVENFIKTEEANGKNPWRAKNSLAENRSAGATILGIRFQDQHWTYDVLGDSCLILIKNNHIEEIISSESTESFDNYPDYYDSNPKIVGKGRLKTDTRLWEDGETILLVSDPFSDFLAKNRGTNNEIKLVERILSINNHNEFENLVDEWRELGMHNDDSTLIIVKQDGSSEFHFEPYCIDNIAHLSQDESIRTATESRNKTIVSSTSKTNDALDREQLKNCLLKFFQEFFFEKNPGSLKGKKQMRHKLIKKLTYEIIDFLKTDGKANNN